MALAVLAGCGEEAAAPSTPEDDGGFREVGVPDADETGRDFASDSAGISGDLCLDDSECLSGLCIRIQPPAPEGVCSNTCESVVDCPDPTWNCVPTSTRDDDEQICLPTELCIDRDGDEYGIGPGCRGPDCEDEDSGINPGAAEVCDGIDNDCNLRVDDNAVDSSVECDTGEEGICAEGTAFCVVGELRCERVRAPGTEDCNGEDDDCDGAVDEDDNGDSLAVPCYAGSRATLDVGECHGGVSTCSEGRYGECVGQRLPFTEVCDGLDNDCDGDTDEDNPGGGLVCDTGALGVCGDGRSECTAEGALICLQVNTPSDEVCDGLDNDCDGDIDEDADGDPLTVDCYDGPDGTIDVGLCHGGQQTCEGGEFGPCIGDVVPVPEICDGENNDCDDETDEGDPSGGQICLTGLFGECAYGTTSCLGGETLCVTTQFPGDEIEICDGVDNDCDGAIDEDAENDPLSEACYTGPEDTLDSNGDPMGECREGTRTCFGGEWGSCQDQVLPIGELCDTFDNDCDGDSDEENPGGGLLCNTGVPGICAEGLTACSGGDITCELQVQPYTEDEVCDGVDNDCDGLTDEDADGNAITRSCYAGPVETLAYPPCQAGVQTCQAGGFGACEGQVLPGTEVCDGEDNDCTGVADDGDISGVGLSCHTGLSGVCGAGALACTAGELICVGSIQPNTLPEVCDGEDNDCDGFYDEDTEGLGETCVVGTGDCQRAGVKICDPDDDEGPPICSVTAPTEGTAEVCDYNDNNCDGYIDEDFSILVDGKRVYNTADNCGGCDVDCAERWPGGPASYNVTPICTVTGDVAACDFTCAGDAMDLDGIDENGCEFSPDLQAVYVSRPTDDGEDTPGCDDDTVPCCGDPETPCATITFGIQRAHDAGRSRVRVSEGVFTETVEMADGISLLGGHNPVTWVQNPEVNVTVIRPKTTSNASSHRVAVTIDGVTSSTTFAGFTVEAENARQGGNSIGIQIIDSNGFLVVEDNVVLAGRGGNGGDGEPGGSGANGVSAGDGADRVTQDSCDSFSLSGGAGGERICADPDGGGTTDVSGGSGGDSLCPEFDPSTGSALENGSGEPGSGPNPGDGGAGGYHQLSLERSGHICAIANEGGADAGPGTPPPTHGVDGAGGTAGADAAGFVESSGLVWRGYDGLAGAHGAHGSGGGGGGASGGVEPLTFSDPPYYPSSDGLYYFAASGGGGGSGGCAGERGTGGTSGGGSFGIFVTFTGDPPSVSSAMPIVRNNAISRGPGGLGGNGGNGGAGGDPGLGGLAGEGADEPYDYDFCMVDGGIGANGGRGGHGGGGAGGAGGVSFDVYVYNSNGLDRDYATGNQFTVDAVVDTGGAGGRGGNSSNTATGVGEDGPTGESGNLWLAP